MDNDDPAPGRAAAVYTGRVTVCWIGCPIIACAGPPATTHNDVADGTREGRSTKTIAERCSVPGVATVAATTPIAAASSPRVLSVTDRVSVRAATTRIARRSASVATAGKSFNTAVEQCTQCRICQVTRTAGNSFSFRTICCACREGAVIVLRTARTTS